MKKKHNRDVMTKEAKKGWNGLRFSDAGCATLRLTATRQIAVPEDLTSFVAWLKYDMMEAHASV